jgi:hypothetical protein
MNNLTICAVAFYDIFPLVNEEDTESNTRTLSVEITRLLLWWLVIRNEAERRSQQACHHPDIGELVNNAGR